MKHLAGTLEPGKNQVCAWGKIVKETEKAVLIAFDYNGIAGGKENWVPKAACFVCAHADDTMPVVITYKKFLPQNSDGEILCNYDNQEDDYYHKKCGA